MQPMSASDMDGRWRRSRDSCETGKKHMFVRSCNGSHIVGHNNCNVAITRTKKSEAEGGLSAKGSNFAERVSFEMRHERGAIALGLSGRLFRKREPEYRKATKLVNT